MLYWLYTQGANILTLLRVPCMLGILGCLFYTPMTLGWFWLAALLLTVGLILDWADGYYARNIAPQGPTRLGKFLDQFFDKWGFAYPLFAGLTYVHRDTLPAEWSVLLIILLGLDIDSCYEHWKDYCRPLVMGKINPKHGAVWFGKAKFVLQSVAICVVTASLCPYIKAESLPLWAVASNMIGWLGLELYLYAHILLIIAAILAVLSLRQRMRRAAEEERAQVHS